MYCPHCGAECEPANGACSRCGADVRWVQARLNVRSPLAYPTRSYGVLIAAIVVTVACFPITGVAAIVYAAQSMSRRDAGNDVEADRLRRVALIWIAISVLIYPAIFGIVFWLNVMHNGF